MGATLGGLFGILAMGGLYAVSEVPTVESVLHVRYVLGPDGPAGALGTTALAWAVAPIAAAVAGWFNADRAVRGQRWAGARMGYVAYGLAILIAPIAVFAAASVATFDPSDPIEAVQGASGVVLMSMLFAALAGLLLAPLLMVCAAAGAVWAGAIRSVVGRIPPTADLPPPAAANGTTLALIATILALLWLVGAAVLVGDVFWGGESID
jgi:hypothetical protein